MLKLNTPTRQYCWIGHNGIALVEALANTEAWAAKRAAQEIGAARARSRGAVHPVIVTLEIAPATKEAL